MFKCNECEKGYTTSSGLGVHISRTHKINLEEYYIKYIKSLNENICECGNKTSFINMFKGYKKLCKGCSNVLRLQNISLALKGRTKSEYEYLKKFSIDRRGKNNPRFNRSEEDWQKSYKKLSKTMKEKIASGEFTPCVTNSWANSRTKLKIGGFDKLYRSSWEAVFQILNPTYEYEKIRIQYVSPKDDELHNYIVDFVDEENKILYEIKPRVKMNDKIVLAKEKYAKIWCETHNYQYKLISNDWFQQHAEKLDYNNYDIKIKRGMKQFL